MNACGNFCQRGIEPLFTVINGLKLVGLWPSRLINIVKILMFDIGYFRPGVVIFTFWLLK